jgi:tetratricopeptide (TPR) repeat protein
MLRLPAPTGLIMLFSAAVAQAQVPPQTSADSYTRYELQAPGSAAFRILYDVTATTPGARRYYNTVRAGATVTVHGVTDLHTGTALSWRIVDGATARAGEHPNASLDDRYIEVSLPRAVPRGGSVRVRIDKTYVDSASYRVDNGELLFSRSLGIPLNSVVLPAGHELVSVNVPSQIEVERDGRIRLSFMHAVPQAVTYTVRARALPAAAAAALERAAATARPRVAAPATTTSGYDGSYARTDRTFAERAAETRDIVYFLEQPETSAFRLYHDYTETRAGTERYLNVVRAGSRVVDPEAYNLDTGEELRVETLGGAAATARGVLSEAQAAAGSEVVVITFPAVAAGASTRLRIHETYIDTSRYVRSGDELVWDRNFGRARNSVVLPQGWYVTASDMPATVTTRDDGRIMLTYWNARPDGLQTFIRGRVRGDAVATSLEGEKLYARPHPQSAALERAEAALRAAPANVDRMFDMARELERAFRYDEALALYTRMTELAPQDWRGWRFRGHRNLTLRQFEEGARHLERARELAPYNFDVAYHLGLAYYLLGRFDDAATEYVRCTALATDPRALLLTIPDQRTCMSIAQSGDTRVAIEEWTYRALRRSGREREARALLAAVPRGLSVSANASYYHNLLARRGEWPAADLVHPLPADGRFETRAYGAAVDALLDGPRERALFLLRRIATDPHWSGFGRIAAEVDLARVR